MRPISRKRPVNNDFGGFSSKNPLRVKGQINWWVNSENYNVVEMTHHIWLLGVVELMRQLQPLEVTKR